jgi:hypothetical protein
MLMSETTDIIHDKEHNFKKWDLIVANAIVYSLCFMKPDDDP